MIKKILQTILLFKVMKNFNSLSLYFIEYWYDFLWKFISINHRIVQMKHHTFKGFVPHLNNKSNLPTQFEADL